MRWSNSRRRHWSPVEQRMAAIAFVLAIGFGSIVAAGGYISSLDVAAVKAEGASLDERIRLAREQVRRMRMELAIRTRLVQQERWAPVLGLRTPDPRQFGRSGGQVHALAEARQASLLTPRASSLRPAAPRDAHPGYDPAARRQLDGLIGASLPEPESK